MLTVKMQLNAGDDCRRYEVTVCDGGTPGRSATQSLVIQVVDVNDELPRFDKTAYYFSVAESRPLGTVVGTLRATDADVSPAFSRVTYTMPQVRLVIDSTVILYSEKHPLMFSIITPAFLGRVL